MCIRVGSRLPLACTSAQQQPNIVSDMSGSYTCLRGSSSFLFSLPVIWQGARLLSAADGIGSWTAHVRLASILDYFYLHNSDEAAK